MMSTANRVVKNTGILYIKMVITMFISLYSTRLVLAALGVSDFGVFNVVGGAVAMLGFLNASMAGATQRFMSFAQGACDFNKINKIFNMSVILHLTIAGILFIVLEVAGYFFFNGILNIAIERQHTAKLIYQFMIISTMFTVMSVPYDALLNAHENMLFFSILGVFEALMKLTIALSITYLIGDKLLLYGLFTATLSITLLIINRIYCHRIYAETKIALKKMYDKKLLIEMSNFAGLSFIGSASSMIAGYGSGIILNFFHGTIVNAANAVSGQLNAQLMTFSSNMLKALNPVIAKSEGNGNREFMIKATLTGTKFSFFMFAILGIPFIIETPYILSVWLKNVPEWAEIFCRLSIVFTLIEQTASTLGTAIGAVGDIKKSSIYSSITSLGFMLILFIVFHLGAAPYFMPIISILAAITMVLIKLYFAKKLCGISYKIYYSQVFIKIFVVSIISLLTGVLPMFFIAPSFIRLIIVGLFSVTSFIVTLYYYALSIDEKLMLIKMKNLLLSKINHY